MLNVCRGSWRCGRGIIAEAVAEAVNNFLSTTKEKRTKLIYHPISPAWSAASQLAIRRIAGPGFEGMTHVGIFRPFLGHQKKKQRPWGL